jgi:hypothetical protein
MKEIRRAALTILTDNSTGKRPLERLRLVGRSILTRILKECGSNEEFN